MIAAEQERRLTADETLAGRRLDAAVLPEEFGLSRSRLQALIAEGAVTVNGSAAIKSQRLHLGDEIVLCLPPMREYEAEPEDIPLNIVYEDNELLVVNKERGMVVHPSPGHYSGTLVNALLYSHKSSLSGINGVLRPGIVHRIDKDTSGLLLVAKTDEAHRSLSGQIAEHSLLREYRAVVYGGFGESTGTVSAPLGRSPKDRKKRAVLPVGQGREAVTHYEVLARYRGFSELALRLTTGRTHQIRVHMAHIGHPVAGDAVYGPKKCITSLCGQCLHAKTIGFIHPKTGEQMLFDSELPAYFTEFLASLGTV